MAHEVDNYKVPQKYLDMTHEEIKEEIERLSLEIEQKRAAGLIPSRKIDEKYRKIYKL